MHPRITTYRRASIESLLPLSSSAGVWTRYTLSQPGVKHQRDGRRENLSRQSGGCGAEEREWTSQECRRTEVKALISWVNGNPWKIWFGILFLASTKPESTLWLVTFKTCRKLLMSSVLVCYMYNKILELACKRQIGKLFFSWTPLCSTNALDFALQKCVTAVKQPRTVECCPASLSAFDGEQHTSTQPCIWKSRAMHTKYTSQPLQTCW